MYVQNAKKGGQFSKACCSANVNFLQNNNKDQPTEEDDQLQCRKNNHPVAFAEFTSQNGCEELQRDNFSVMEISESLDVKKSAKITDEDLNEHMV